MYTLCLKEIKVFEVKSILKTFLSHRNKDVQQIYNSVFHREQKVGVVKTKRKLCRWELGTESVTNSSTTKCIQNASCSECIMLNELNLQLERQTDKHNAFCDNLIPLPISLVCANGIVSGLSESQRRSHDCDSQLGHHLFFRVPQLIVMLLQVA